MSRIFLPGFALHSAMYSRLDAAQDASCIDIIPAQSWDATIANISDSIETGSIAIGYSLGGRLALGAALSHPNKFAGLVLISAHAGLTDTQSKERRIQDEIRAQEVLGDREEMLKKFDTNELFDPLDENDQSVLTSSRIPDNQILADQLRILGLGSMPHYEQRLNELRIPVLYITGVRDVRYCSLAMRYKKQTPFSHHRVVDADHRVPFATPRILSLYIEWFANNVL